MATGGDDFLMFSEDEHENRSDYRSRLRSSGKAPQHAIGCDVSAAKTKKTDPKTLQSETVIPTPSTLSEKSEAADSVATIRPMPSDLSVRPKMTVPREPAREDEQENPKKTIAKPENAADFSENGTEIVTVRAVADAIDLVDDFLYDISENVSLLAKVSIRSLSQPDEETVNAIQLELEADFGSTIATSRTTATRKLFDPTDPLQQIMGMQGKQAYDPQLFEEVYAEALTSRKEGFNVITQEVTEKMRENLVKLRKQARAEPGLPKFVRTKRRFLVSHSKTVSRRDVNAEDSDSDGQSIYSVARDAISNTALPKHSTPHAAPIFMTPVSRKRDDSFRESRARKRQNQNSHRRHRSASSNSSVKTRVASRSRQRSSSEDSRDSGKSFRTAVTSASQTSKKRSGFPVPRPAMIPEFGHLDGAAMMEFTIKSIGEFSGMKSEDVKSYLMMFERETGSLQEDSRLRVFKRTLTGAARHWFETKCLQDSHAEKQPTMTDWTRRLMKKFDQELHARKEAESRCRQRIDENAQDYVARKLRLIEAANPAGLDEASKVHMLKAGVHPVYARNVNTRLLLASGVKDCVTTFEDMLEDAIELYRENEGGCSSKGRFHEPTLATADVKPDVVTMMSRQLTELAEKMGKLEFNIQQRADHQNVTPENGSQDRSQQREIRGLWFHPNLNRPIAPDECLNCLSKQHLIRDCPVPRRPGLARRSSSATRRPDANPQRQNWRTQREQEDGRTAVLKTAAMMGGNTASSAGGNPPPENL